MLCCGKHEHVLHLLHALQQRRIAARGAPCVLQVDAKVIAEVKVNAKESTVVRKGRRCMFGFTTDLNNLCR